MESFLYGPVPPSEASARGKVSRKRGARVVRECRAFLDWLLYQPRAFVIFRKRDLKALRC